MTVCIGVVGFVALTLSGADRVDPASATGTTTTTSTTVPVLTTLPSSVSLIGQGTGDVDSEILGWSNGVYGKKGGVNLTYLQEAGGSEQGRDSLLAGTSQYAISGAPYTASQLAAYKTGASKIIAVPIMPSAVGFLLNPPSGGFFIQNNAKGDSPDYTGEVREPADNIVAQELNYNQEYENDAPGGRYTQPGITISPYGEWDNPNLLANWDPHWLGHYHPTAPVGEFFKPYLTSPEQVQQAEANEDNLYMEDWAAAQAPTIWAGLQKQAAGHSSTITPWVPDEQPQPTQDVTEQGGLTNTLQLIEDGAVSSNINDGGVVGAVPPSSLDSVLATQAANIARCIRLKKTDPTLSCNTVAPPDGQNFEWIYVQNHAGEWVAPSPTSIDAAIDASPTPAPTATTGATALWASTHSVHGGYPLTYVDYLYAPATGLTIPQTEAMATLIRYLVTDGQDQLAAHGDGRLSTALVTQALASANHLVDSDCPAAGGQVVATAEPGPYSPGTPKLDALGTEDHCAIKSAAPPTTTTSSTTPASTTTTTTTTVATTTTTPQSTTTAPPTTVFATGTSSTAAPSTPTTRPPLRSGRATKPRRSTGARHHRRAAPPEARTISAEQASALPFAVASGNGAGLDKLGALGVGVVGFLLLRRRGASLLKKLFNG